MFALSNQQLIVSQLTPNPRLLGGQRSKTVRFMASWIKANDRPHVAAVADHAFGKPALIALVVIGTILYVESRSAALDAHDAHWRRIAGQ